jgi:hypothetical protein
MSTDLAGRPGGGAAVAGATSLARPGRCRWTVGGVASVWTVASTSPSGPK